MRNFCGTMKIKKNESPLKEIEKVEEPPIKEESSKEDDKYTRICPSCKSLVLPEEMAGPKHCDLCEKHSTFTPQDVMAISELEEIARADNDDIHKIAAPTDLNPLQEPIKEEPTTPTTPPQDVVPMGKPLDHNAPQKGDRVFVSSDLTDEKAGFEATFISTYKSKGIDFSIVETDDGDLIDIESHRVVKTSEGSGAQDTEPVMEPTIEAPKEQDIPVTPKMDDFHTSSQDSFLALKIEAEALLKNFDSIGKTAFCFPKDGIQKEAAQNDSAFEGNGWVRVWVDQDDVELDKRYSEVLKNPDENARIVALKEIARDIAYNNLHDGVENAGMYANFNFSSLAPSDHDRIDWVALANPVNEEEEDLEFEREQLRKYGPEAVNPDFKDQIIPKSSLESKVEKVASDFEKGISQNKTADEDTRKILQELYKKLDKAEGEEAKKIEEQIKMYSDEIKKKADEPAVEKESSGAEDVMRGQAGDRGIGKIWVKDSYDGSTVTMSSHFANKAEFDKWAASKIAGSTTREIVRSEFPVAAAKKASDFEKGISQNKTSDETLPAKTEKKNPSLKDKDIDPYKFHSDLEWEAGDPCKLCKSPIDENCQCTNDKCEFHRQGQAYPAEKPEGSEPDQVDLIMAYESGELDEAGILKLFSELIKSGQAWSLQGSYGRTAKALIDAGYINEKGTITKDVVDTELAPEQNLLESKYSFKNMKTAADPTEAPKTQFKDYKITPKYTPKEQAVPATPEMDDVLTKIDSLQSNLATLEAARKQIQAKMKEELTKIDDQGERAQMEAALQESIEKAAVLLSAMDNKVVQWKDKLFTLQTEQIDYVPSLTPKEMLAKIYAKFEGAEKYVQDVLNGMISQAKSVVEKTLVRWPNKKSSVDKEANILDDLNHYNEELLAALKELSSPL